jgi:hypothetical protein
MGNAFSDRIPASRRGFSTFEQFWSYHAAMNRADLKVTLTS